MDDGLESVNALENLAIMVKYVNTHFEAGHGFESSELITDLNTLLVDLHRVLDILGPPATIEQRISFLVREIVTIKENTEVILDIIATGQSIN